VVEVSGDLQRDFSLNQTLSLYLVETIDKVDRASPTYALDLLSLVEAILENPDVILYKQLDKLKTERMAAMKAEGIEYEQRIAELEEMEWPKPNRDFIYATFNAFAEKHPWVGEENIRPKSVAREMFEGFTSFDDYVRDYGLQRSEGVLLRYLSEAFKTLEQTVPAAARTDEVLDMLADFRALVRGVDSSLIDEWQSLKERPLTPTLSPPSGEREKDDPRAFAARVRGQLHRLIKALATRDHAAAARLLIADGAEPWTPERLEQAMAPYWAAHTALLTTPEARRPHQTRIDQLEPGRFRVQQRLIDPEGDEDWALDCIVDVTEARAEDAPLLDLQRIGV
jgi:hypothetical protein